MMLSLTLFLLLVILITVVTMLLSYQISDVRNDLKHDINKLLNSTDNIDPVSFDNKPNATMGICGPVYKIMEQWMPSNEYECHEV